MERSIPLPCPTCATRWVDQAVVQSDVCLTDRERRQLIAALLARPHLLFSGPSGTGKQRLARALAQILAGEQADRVRVLQGHPWWAAKTGDVAAFVTAQMNYNAWRVADFVSKVVTSAEQQQALQGVQEYGPFVLCVVGMSPVEVDFYFRGIAGLWRTLLDKSALAQSVRIVGTTDGETSTHLSPEIAHIVAVVHLGGAYRGSTRTTQPASNGRTGKNGQYYALPSAHTCP